MIDPWSKFFSIQAKQYWLYSSVILRCSNPFLCFLKSELQWYILQATLRKRTTISANQTRWFIFEEPFLVLFCLFVFVFILYSGTSLLNCAICYKIENNENTSGSIVKNTCLTQMLLVMIWSLLSCVGRKKLWVETTTDECLTDSVTRLATSVGLGEKSRVPPRNRIPLSEPLPLSCRELCGEQGH